MDKNINVLMYSAFTRMLPTTKYITKIFGKNIAGAKVLFIPFADEGNKYYIALCKQALLLSGVNKQNISTLSSHTHKNNKFDIIFVSGGNVCKLKNKLVEIGWWEELKSRIESGVLYIGDSAGSVILGKTISHTLEYEPYNPVPESLDGFNIIGKSVVVHYSKVKYSSGKIVDDKDCYMAHVKQTEFLGKNNYMTIKNNQLYIIDKGKLKSKTLCWHKIIKSTVAQSNKFGKRN